MIAFLKKFKLWLLGLFIPIVFAATIGTSNPSVVEVPEKVILGYTATGVFENIVTRERIVLQMTEQEHIALREKNANYYFKDGYKWIQSSLTPIYSVTLNDYEYKKSGVDAASTTQVRIKIPNYTEAIIPITDIVDNKLTDEGLNKIKSQ